MASAYSFSDVTIFYSEKELMNNVFLTISEGDRIGGDLFISLDTVRSNSEAQGTAYDEELHRVIIHGILHLCGINDKGPGERAIMEAAENKALQARVAGK